jgi:opacity protein-like surface antigen
MRPQRTTLAVVLAILVLPVLTEAQTRPGIRVYSTFGSTQLAATDSFEAVTGTSRSTGLGGGVTVTRLWRGVFADVSFAQTKLDGERVFIHEGTIYELGIPVEITMQPLDAVIGWRFDKGRLSPFAGAGYSSMSYRETSGFSSSGDDVNERASGPMVMAGADVAILRWLHVGGEVRYRAIDGVLGRAGVSEVYGENSLGGMSAALRLSVGR